MADFESDYRQWLEAVLPDHLPADVDAFCFNLYNSVAPESLFGVELIGASLFDPTDPDWPCAESWEPPCGRSVEIPADYSGDCWEDCLDRMHAFIQRIVEEGSDLSRRLAAGRGIGIGFVDAHVQTVWSAAS